MGRVTLNANKAGVTLARNTVAGAVTASANLKGTVISGNRIGGALTCTSNVPPPTNAGVRNAVAGGRSGQTCCRPDLLGRRFGPVAPARNRGLGLDP